MRQSIKMVLAIWGAVILSLALVIGGMGFLLVLLAGTAFLNLKRVIWRMRRG